MSTPELDTVLAEVRAWLEAHFDPALGLVEWRNQLADSGWGVPHWPGAWFGRDLPVSYVAAIEAEFDRLGAVGIARAGIRLLAAATLLEHGDDGHKQRFLRRILTGEDTWCQLFSEPGSGSDLAGATTRADRDGDRWIVNGQKVWTTSAHHADWALLLARTDWDAPKHEGLSYFVIDMRQAGVEVQPLKQMNGYASFNQVFLTDAVVESDNLVGNVIVDGQFDFRLGQEVHDVLRAAVELGVALLASEALHFRHGHPLDAHALQRLLHLVELEGLDDGFDLLHGGCAPR